MKTACVLRWGAFGDCIQTTPIFPLLKKDGYKVCFHTKSKGGLVVRNNPYVDKVVIQKDNMVPKGEIEDYWNLIGSQFDKFINLSGSIEERLLIPGKPGWKQLEWSKEKRHEYCNINYSDYTLKIAGYPNAENKNGELYFSKLEERIVKKWRKKHKNKFIVMWALSGSSLHKVYPYTDYIVKHLVGKHKDIMIVFVGHDACQILEIGLENHPQVKPYSGKMPIRKVLCMTKYVDLVVGPETGVLNAAACYDTPKVVILSHSTEENLTKHWTNCIAVLPNVDCYPCHILHFNMDYCHRDDRLGSPVCMAKLKPEKIIKPIERFYNGNVDFKRRTDVL